MCREKSDCLGTHPNVGSHRRVGAVKRGTLAEKIKCRDVWRKGHFPRSSEYPAKVCRTDPVRTPNRIATVTREPKDKLPPPNHDLTDQTKLDADAELTPMPGRPPRPPDRGNSPTRLRFQRFDEGALQEE